jgi:hypothetical protein
MLSADVLANGFGAMLIAAEQKPVVKIGRKSFGRITGNVTEA